MIDDPTCGPSAQFCTVNIAGIPVQIRFLEHTLGRTFSETFPHTTGLGNNAALTLTVTPAPPNINNLPDEYLLDGYGEYTGTLDLKSGRGTISLTGSGGLDAFLNCLRQVYARTIIARGGAILHAACVVKNKRCYIFHGPSGAGKSTLCELSNGCTIASDDLTAVRKLDGKFLAWGLPARTHSSFSPGPYPITGLFQLRQSATVRVLPVTPAKTAAAILTIPGFAVTRQQVANMLDLISELADRIPCWELHFRKDASFWNCISTMEDQNSE
jgi:hypothetical protein